MTLLVKKILFSAVISIAVLIPFKTHAYYDIHIVDRGVSDANDGRSYAKGVRTLERAHEILIQNYSEITEDVRLIVHPGAYVCRGMRGTPWTFKKTNINVSIEASRDLPNPAEISQSHAYRPIFIGNTRGLNNEVVACGSSVWLEIEHPESEMSLTVKDMKIEQYRGGVTLRAENPNGISAIDQNITIENVVFEKIGQTYHNPRGTVGKGAILLDHSNGNTIKDNYFHHIRNPGSNGELIHGIYFTHASSRNYIDNNFFFGTSGTAIKMSDFSNFNTFENNRFASIPSVYIDRWCGSFASDTLQECETYHTGYYDCPSWGNSFNLETNWWSSMGRSYAINLNHGANRFNSDGCWIQSTTDLRLHLGTEQPAMYGTNNSHTYPN